MLLTKCEIQEFPCTNVDYSSFDAICSLELKTSIKVESIINHSAFCVLIPISDDLRLEGLETNDYLKSLHKKMGIYHLWVDYDQCDDHKKHTMKCIYVGKGFAQNRVDIHIKQKFPNADTLYVSFYECSNRISKYLEQLFLDTYQFEFNKAENVGEHHLYAVWDEDRHDDGTEIYELANIYAKHIGPGPYTV